MVGTARDAIKLGRVAGRGAAEPARACTVRSEVLDRWVEDRPLVIIEDGRGIGDRLKKARVDIKDVMEQARLEQGLERLDQIKYAVLESSGSISIIPK